MAANHRTPPPLKLQRYFIKYLSTQKHSLSCSDAESLYMKDLVSMADEECKALWETLYLGYTDSQGHSLLREEVSKLYANISADNVLVVTPQEGVYIGMKALASVSQRKSGNIKPHVVVTFPTYQSLYENLRSFGCDVSYWTVRCGGKGWYFDMDELKSALRPETKVLVVNFPHNPTGYLPSDKEWDHIVQICKEYNLYLFSDEMYRGTHNDGIDENPSACSVYDDAITLSGLSKSFGMAGLRIGWVCTKNASLMKAMAEFKDYTTMCSSAPSEILGVIALRNAGTLIQRVITLLKLNLKAADEFFAKYPDLFEWRPLRASTVGFLKLKSPLLALGEGGATGFCNVLRNEADIFALPSAVYDFPDEYIRIGFGKANFAEVLVALGKFLGSRFRP